jgi:hypothetical protein
MQATNIKIENHPSMQSLNSGATEQGIKMKTTL